jgi:hypothetical protein
MTRPQLTKHSRPPTRYQLPIRTALEQHGLAARTLAVPKCAYCLCRLVLEAFEHLVQLQRAEGEHEPLSVSEIRCHKSLVSEGRRLAYMYGPGRSFIALKHRQVSSTNTGPLTYDQISRYTYKPHLRLMRFIVLRQLPVLPCLS